MSKESAKQFIARLVDDEEFLARFASTQGGQRRRQAEEEGFDFTSEELQQAKTEYLAEKGSRAYKPPNGDVQPLYGVVDDIL